MYGHVKRRPDVVGSSREDEESQIVELPVMEASLSTDSFITASTDSLNKHGTGEDAASELSTSQRQETGVKSHQDLHGLTERTKSKAKMLLHANGSGALMNGAMDNAMDKSLGAGPALENVNTNLAFNPSQLKSVASKGKYGSNSIRSKVKKTKSALHFVAGSISYPKKALKSTVKRKAAGNISKLQEPFQSKEADMELLEAHDELLRAESDVDLPADAKRDAVESQKENVKSLEKQRESTLVAWVTSRHMQGARAVEKRQIAFPKLQDYTVRDGEGKEGGYTWELWLGHLLLYLSQDFTAQYIDNSVELPFSMDTLRLYTERIVVASDPWQAWFMHLRKVYRWDDPLETAYWLSLFSLLWYTSKIMTFVYSYIIYMVIRNYYYPTSVRHLRESIARLMGQGATAHKFGEVIGKHGRADWLQPVIDELGPFFQVQLGDAANLLEVLYNFYYWKSPRKTAASLFFFFPCFLISAVADMEYCMKVFWFIAGFTFFFCWPISSRYPKYRYLVSPVKWVLWDIPMHPEWAFHYLQREAQLALDSLTRNKLRRDVTNETASPNTPTSATSTLLPCETVNDSGEDRKHVSQVENDALNRFDSTQLGDEDILGFDCVWNGKTGKLHISASSIYFTRNSLTRMELWRRPLLGLVEVRKLPQSRKIQLESRRCLMLKFRNGDTFQLRLKDRDRVFNFMVGFSHHRWQAVHKVK